MIDLTFDWNQSPQLDAPVQIQDATLAEATRDPRVGPLGFEDARSMLEQSQRLEVDSIDLGWIVDGPGLERLRSLLQGFRGQQAVCSVRAEPNLLKALARCADETRVALQVMIAGDAPLNACRRAHELGLRTVLTILGAENLEPWRLAQLLTLAADAGCLGVHFFDHSGGISVAGVGHVVRFARHHFAQAQRELSVCWSGSDLHGLALAKALEAIDAGAHSIRASALGLGQNGYTPLELLLVNLRLDGRCAEPFQELARYVQLASQKLAFSIPGEYPVFGLDAFRTATGVHAAAVVKAPSREAADLVYSSVPASWFGAEQEIEIGPMSGKWNVIRWLGRHHQVIADSDAVERILNAAKSRDRVLNELEVFELLHVA